MNRLDILAPIEKKAVELMVQGKTNEQIGIELGVKEKTARNYLIKARRKTGSVTNRALEILWEQHGPKTI